MVIKPRMVPTELKILRSLNHRMSLPAKYENHYMNLEKGFIGEQKFDELLANLVNGDCLILNSLLFEVNNTLFQIDSLLIVSETIYLFEIKYFEGDFLIDEDKWYLTSGKAIKNPLHQLRRSETLFGRLLQDLELYFSVKAYLTFANPNFFLYQAPLNQPIIFPTQLDRFLNKLNMETSKLNHLHFKSAEKLLSFHQNDSPYTRLPEYTFNQLKKGITCLNCHSFITEFTGKLVVCQKCGCQEDTVTAVLRSIEEIRMLFPDQKITTNSIHEWCDIIQSKKTIRRILSRNFKSIGSGKYTYYVSNDAAGN